MNRCTKHFSPRSRVHDKLHFGHRTVLAVPRRFDRDYCLSLVSGPNEKMMLDCTIGVRSRRVDLHEYVVRE